MANEEIKINKEQIKVNNDNNNNTSKKEEENKKTVTSSIYGDIRALPSQDAVNGIKFDFNSGLRVYFPENEKNQYHLQFFDNDSNLLLYDADVKNGTVISSVKKYYINYHFIITDKNTKKIIFEHYFNLKNKKVIVQFPVGTLGDSLGWFSYVERFQKKTQCNLILCISQFLIDIVKKQYPNYKYISKEQVKDQNSYACYYLGLFFKNDRNFQPVDFRQVGLHKTAGMILGLRTKEELEDEPVRLDLSAERKIKDKYVVIATKASSQAKFWNNPHGWYDVINFLKENGYRVICIDKDVVYGTGLVYNYLPWGVENETGDKPLQERINLIKDADFFIGLSSGLAWLAWCCKIPVVMISGFSLPKNEFYTPYRIINYQVCNGCWDDLTEEFDHSDFLWCPKHKNDNQQFECTKTITSTQVINVIKQIPAFKSNKK